MNFYQLEKALNAGYVCFNTDTNLIIFKIFSKILSKEDIKSSTEFSYEQKEFISTCNKGISYSNQVFKFYTKTGDAEPYTFTKQDRESNSWTILSLKH